MLRARRIASTVAAATLCSLLTACSVRVTEPAASAVLQLRGHVHGGQQPVSGAVIQLYAANTSVLAGPATTLVASTVTTDPTGSFLLDGKYTCPTQTSTPVYLVATGGNPGLGSGTNNAALALMAALGPCSSLSASTFVNIDEVTTVAAVYGLGSSIADYSHVGGTSLTSITSAFSLAGQLASTATGTAPGSGLPAGSYAPSPKLNTLADSLAPCINSDGTGATGNATPCGQLFTATTYSGTKPADTIGATVAVANNTATGVGTVFNLGGASPPFQPSLAVAPSDWTMTIASVAWPTPAAIPYNTPIGATQLNAAATIPGSFNYSPIAGAVLPLGQNTLSTTFTPTDTADYPNIPASVTLTVSQATPTITWNVPTGMSYSVPLSGTQLNATASVPGSFVYSPAAGSVLTVGSHTLGVTFTPSDSTDYTTASTNVPISVNNPTYSWGNVAIVGGGYVTGIVVHPTAANVRYARTDVGGAYRWSQTAAKWVAMTDSISDTNRAGCESIAVDPTNASNVYLAMGEYTESFGENGIFLISNDGGNTFAQVTAGFKMGSNDNGRTAGERMAVDPNLPSKLYYGSYKDGLWVSTNSGLAWAKVSSFPVYSATAGGAGTAGVNASSSTGYNGAGIVFVDFVASSGGSGSATPVIYVGVSDTGTSGTGYSSLYVSTNGGTSWTAVPGQPTGYYPIRGVIGPDAAGPNDILYVTYSNGIGPGGITAGALYKYVLPPSTSPGGNGTWTNIVPPTSVRQSGAQGGFNSVAADPNNPGVIMASTIDDYYPGDDLYRSTNYGSTWVSVVLKQGATFNTSLSPWITFGGTSTSTGTWPGSLVIDPANSNHVMYGTGQTLWDSTNIQTSDSGGKATFNIGAAGIEETVAQALASPPTGPYLVSGVDDIAGFVHTSLSTSPASGMILGNAINLIVSIDFAQGTPTTLALAGGNTTGAYSTNSGTNWTKFSAAPAGTTAGRGQIAVSANGGTFVWATSDAAVAYTTNNGSTWTASTGAIQKSGVAADRVNPNKFYIYSGGTLQISTNGGQSFANAATGVASSSSAVLVASPAAEGDLWLGSSSTGLFHSTNSGTNFSAVSGFKYVTAIGFGAAAPGASYPAIYIVGTSTGGTYGFYRSVNGGGAWTQINDASHQWGYVHYIVGDPKTFGTTYLTTGGRGIIYGTSPY